MNFLFIHHDPEIQAEISATLQSRHDTCYFSRNTDETISILNHHPIGLAVLIVNHMRDAAVLKYLNDNYKQLEVLLLVSEGYDEIITLFSEGQYQTFRMHPKRADLMANINRMIEEHSLEPQLRGSYN